MNYEEQRAGVVAEVGSMVESINTAMDKKELAEKVAGMLGWTSGCRVSRPLPENKTPILSTFDGWTTAHGACVNDDLPEHVFNWLTVGLCIEKVRELGWELVVLPNGELYFLKNGLDWKRSKDFSSKELGHIEAIIRAFAEIPMEVEG